MSTEEFSVFLFFSNLGKYQVLKKNSKNLHITQIIFVVLGT